MTIPAPPTGLKVASGGAGVLTLTWTASQGAASYQIFDATTSNGEVENPAVETGIAGTSATVTGLTPAQQYFFKVSAVDSGGVSSPSAEASGTVVPAVPSGVSATAGNGSVSLSWSPGDGCLELQRLHGHALRRRGGAAADDRDHGERDRRRILQWHTVLLHGRGRRCRGRLQPVQPGECNARGAQSGGGGAIDWLALAGLAALLGARTRRT